MHPKYLHLFTTFNFSPLKYNLIFRDREGDYLIKIITTVLFTLLVRIIIIEVLLGKYFFLGKMVIFEKDEPTSTIKY